MLRFHIANMNCSGCAKGVAAALQNAGAGLEPCFDLEKREVTVEARDEEAARFTTALVQDGWEARLLSLPQHKGRFSEFLSETSCNQEYACGLEQGLDDEAAAIVTERQSPVLQQPGVGALHWPAPLAHA